MPKSSYTYKRHRFPAEIIARAMWLYYRYPLSLRLVEEMLPELGIVVSYGTIRQRCIRGAINLAQNTPASYDASSQVRMIFGIRMIALPGRNLRSKSREGRDQYQW